MVSIGKTISSLQVAIESALKKTKASLFPPDQKIVTILNTINLGLALTKLNLSASGKIADWAAGKKYVKQMSGVLNSLSVLGFGLSFASDIMAMQNAESKRDLVELNRIANKIGAGLAIGSALVVWGIVASPAISALAFCALYASGYSIGKLLIFPAYEFSEKHWDKLSRLASDVLDRVGAEIKGLFPPSQPRRHDPLVLDLNGDGVKLTSLDGSKVNFDFGGDGFAEKTGWVSAQDGLLTLDKNNNGKIDNGSELFGSAREDGFTALSHYDLNYDGKINADDAVFAKLRVWRDANGNGVTDKGELLTLAQAGVQVGIKEVSLEKKASGVDNAGNRIDFTGSFTRTNGKSGDSVAVSFAINQTLTKWKPPAGFKVSAEAGKLPGHFAIAA